MEDKNIDTAVLLTVLTAAAYACAYAFESGYLAHFGLPADVVEVNLRGVLLCLVALLGTGAVMMFQGIFTLIPAKLDPTIARLIYSNLLIVTLIGGALIVLEPPTRTVVFIIGFVGLISFGHFVLPYLLYRKKGLGYLDSLRAASAEDQGTALNSMLQAAGRKWVGIVGVAVLGAYVSYLVGASVAKRQSDFLVADDCVALRVHGDLLVCALWDGALTGEYSFRPAANAKLTIERLGPMPAYTHRSLMPIAASRNEAGAPESDQTLEDSGAMEAQPVPADAVAEGNSADDTRNLPQPQPPQ